MKFRKIIIGVLTIILSMSIMASYSIEEYDVELVGIYDLENTYMINELVNVPQLSLKIDGELVDTKVRIHQPNNVVLSKSQIKLGLPGLYIVEYNALYKNKVYSKKFQFEVTRNLYKFSGTMSSAYYGKPTGYETAPEGIVVSLSQGEKFEFERVIDLKNYYDTNEFLSLYTAPSIAGDLEARALHITLTDIYDEAKYLTFTMYAFPAEWALDNVYVIARSESQTATGMEWSTPAGNPDIIQYLDRGVLKPTLIHRNTHFGTSIGLPMNGKGTSIDDIVGQKIIEFSYDMNQQALYGGMQTDSIKQLIADFDDPVVFNNLWNGFTTGEVKLSITAGEYLKDRFNFVLTNVDNKNLSDNQFSDMHAPMIHIDYEGYEGDIPIGLVGQPYKIFDAIATDNYDEEVFVNKKVYYNYRSKDRALFEIVNDYFSPTKVGQYTIVYESKDSSQNISKTEVDVLVGNDRILEGVLGTYEDDALVGKPYQLPSFELVGLKGFGNIQITAKFQGQSQATYDLTGLTSFIPEEVGDYHITYTYNDYVEFKSQTIEMNATYDGIPYLVSDVIMPKYLIKGSKFALPLQQSVSFEGTTKKTDIATMFIYNDENTSPETHNKESITITANEKLTIIYSATGDINDENNETFEIPVVDVGYDNELDMAKYFHTSGIESTAFRDGILLNYKSGEGSAQFINPLLAHNFSLIFLINQATNHFEVFNIYLEDSIYSNQKIKITYKKNLKGLMEFSINDGPSIELSHAFGSESEVKITLDTLLNRVFPQDDITQTILRYIDGTLFEGFHSQKIYLTLELQNITGDAAVRVINISGQVMNDRKTDLLSPMINTINQRGEYNIDDLVSLSPAYASDVLDPNIEFYMSVIDPDGNHVKTLDGVTLDETANPSLAYILKLEKYGRYRVTYTASDTSAPRPQTFSYDLFVVDNQKPVITLKTNPVTLIRVGDILNIPEADVVDNLTENLDIHMYIQMPSFALVKLENNTFTIPVHGTYTVHYLVYDEAGNLTKYSYQVTAVRRSS